MLTKVKLWEFTPEKILEYRKTATYKFKARHKGRELTDDEVIAELRQLNLMFEGGYVVS